MGGRGSKEPGPRRPVGGQGPAEQGSLGLVVPTASRLPEPCQPGRGGPKDADWGVDLPQGEIWLHQALKVPPPRAPTSQRPWAWTAPLLVAWTPDSSGSRSPRTPLAPHFQQHVPSPRCWMAWPTALRSVAHLLKHWGQSPVGPGPVSS